MLRVLRLSRAELALLFEAGVALTASRAALMLLPYRVAQRWASLRGSSAGESRELALMVAQAIARASGRMPWRSTCLVQALAAQWMLSRRKHEARLRLGVARNGRANLDAHAWLESAGVLVTGGPEGHVARYAVLFSTKKAHL